MVKPFLKKVLIGIPCRNVSVNPIMFGRFKVENLLQDPVAQLVEPCIFNAEVIGSSPIRVTIKLLILKVKTMNLKDKTVVIDNKTYRYSNIVMLETDKQGQFGIILVKDKRDNLLHLYRADKFSNNNLTVQHLYFLSTDKICEGDWYLVELFKVTGESIGLQLEQCKQTEESWINNFDVASTRHKENCFKVIAATNPECNLLKPSDSFLQVYIDAYNKGEKIEECLVEYEKYWANSKGAKGNTFTEVALFEESINDYDAILVYYPKITKGEITIRKAKDSWSNEEVEMLCRKAYREGAAYSIGSHDNFKQIHLTENEWISENL